MRYFIYLLSIISFVSCTNAPTVYWIPYDETAELQANQTHENAVSYTHLTLPTTPYV